jgi:hypothetical protein
VFFAPTIGEMYEHSSRPLGSDDVGFFGAQLAVSWNGVCFGYRRADSLFTYDGIEVGRFSGTEVYAADGSYLGEVRSTEEDVDRLITSSYKKSRMAASFVSTFERAQKRPADRNQEQLHCGYEDFPTPEFLKRI